MSERPNVLFLMTDEHRADIAGYEGDPVVRTPVLDSLAETGTVFSNAYAPSPICVPGRQCMMSGQLPRTCGCEKYGDDLSPGYMTFSKRFAQYAYETVACGKLHHMGVDQMQGWTVRIGEDAHVHPPYVEGKVDEEYKRHKPPRRKWSDAKEIRRAGIGQGIAHRDEYAVQGALNYIQDHFSSPYYDRHQPEKPLLLKVSLIQPHYPYQTSAEKFNYYLNRVRPFSGQKASDHPFLGQKSVDPEKDVTAREIRRAVAAYYGMIETVDDMYKSVLDALEYNGQDLDDWIIVYTSDHGEMLGEHGIWEKQKFYEGSARVPLIIRWPKRFEGGKVVGQNVNHCDLFATLCDMVGIPVPEGLDSRSMVPLLEGRTDNWNNETVSQFGGTNLMIKRDHLKYQYYGSERPEVLFDLEKNPEETVDYIDEPEYRDRVEAFRVRCRELGFGPGAGEEYVNAGYHE